MTIKVIDDKLGQAKDIYRKEIATYLKENHLDGTVRRKENGAIGCFIINSDCTLCFRKYSSDISNPYLYTSIRANRPDQPILGLWDNGDLIELYEPYSEVTEMKSLEETIEEVYRVAVYHDKDKLAENEWHYTNEVMKNKYYQLAGFLQELKQRREADGIT